MESEVPLYIFNLNFILFILIAGDLPGTTAVARQQFSRTGEKFLFVSLVIWNVFEAVCV